MFEACATAGRYGAAHQLRSTGVESELSANGGKAAREAAVSAFCGRRSNTAAVSTSHLPS